MGDLRYNDSYRQVIVFYRKGLLFAFNFSPSNSYTDVKVSIPNYADYEVVFTTDDWKYGGWGQIGHGAYPAQIDENGASAVSLYLPARTAMVLREKEIKRIVKETPAVEEKKSSSEEVIPGLKAADDEKKAAKKTKKPAAGKTAAKKTPAEKTAAKKAASEKTPAKKSAAGKTTAGKRTEK